MTGDITVVANVGIFTEGFDFPGLAVCVLARPTKSIGLYLQMVGRVMRPLLGKTGALVLDHAGCCEEHGQPHFPRAWSLDGLIEKKDTCAVTCQSCAVIFDYNPTLFLETKSRVTKKEKALLICPSCGQATCKSCKESFKPELIKEEIDGVAFTYSASCPHCGAGYSDEIAHILGGIKAGPITSEEDLVALNPDNIPIKFIVLADYYRLLNIAHTKGMKRGWVYYQMKEKWPSNLMSALPKHRKDWWGTVA